MVSTVTPYRSPIRLVQHASEDAATYSSQTISRARKKMMAEIALGGDEILLDDIPYSRNDASALLDVVTEESWKAHNVIYQQKGLLQFLEKDEFNDEELKKADAWLYNAAFVQAVSPYFAHSFNVVSGKLLRGADYDGLLSLLNYQGYILPEHSHEGYQKIRNYLDELSYTLRNLSWEKFIADETVLHFVFSDAWKRFINKLPSTFTSLRDDLVEQLTAIVLRFQHKATWYYLHELLVQLKAIETNDFNRTEVVRIDEIIYKNSQVEGGRSSIPSTEKDGSSGRVIWWVIWIILIIVRAATCNDRSSSRTTFDNESFRQIQRLQTDRTYEHRNEIKLVKFLSSLSQKRSLGQLATLPDIETGGQPFSSFADPMPQTGTDLVTLTNNTAYDCAVIYFDGPSYSGSLYEGALSHTSSVFIKKGDTYSFQMQPGNGAFYFVFGEKWGKLKPHAELTIFSDGTGSASGREQILPVYEFFSNSNPVPQKYLKQAVYLDDPLMRRDDEEFRYLNTPGDAAVDGATELTFVEKNKTFSIEAKGRLTVKEQAPSTLQKLPAGNSQEKISKANKQKEN